jgi:hypothetical protein
MVAAERAGEAGPVGYFGKIPPAAAFAANNPRPAKTAFHKLDQTGFFVRKPFEELLYGHKATHGLFRRLLGRRRQAGFFIFINFSLGPILIRYPRESDVISYVTPAKAGAHLTVVAIGHTLRWMPAFAGMTKPVTWPKGIVFGFLLGGKG